MDKQVNKKILILNLLFYLFELTFVLIFHLGMVYIFDNAINTAFKIYRHYHIFALSSGINIYKNIAFSVINVLLNIPLTLIFLELFNNSKDKYRYLVPIILSNIIMIIFESIQYLTFYGVFDIFDVVCYIIGSLIALYIYYKIKNKTNSRTINKLLKITLIILIIMVSLSIYPIIRQQQYINDYLEKFKNGESYFELIKY